MNPNALSPEEASAHLGVHVSTLKRWARAGRVPGAWQTVGGWWRFRLSGLEQLRAERGEKDEGAA